MFSEPRWPAPVVHVVANLYAAHHAAAEGLFAYHVHRGLPGPSADASAEVVRAALAAGVLTPDELVAAALELVR